jgi:multimeric flavodoxin WrbA
MILGISASGRANGETAKMVKGVLEASGLESTYVSLASKKISGCRGCLKCAGDGICKYRDDWNELAETMKVADAIVFGSPSYTFNISALGHAFLERMYSTRHGRFLLSGKLCVVVTPGAAGNPAEAYIKKNVEHNKMVVLTTVNKPQSIAPCYSCGYGHNCMAGAVVKSHGNVPVDEITPEMFPEGVEDSECVQRAIASAGWSLARAIANSSTRCV